jgi:DNA-binding HxlR family transcriptional regulator
MHITRAFRTVKNLVQVGHMKSKTGILGKSGTLSILLLIADKKEQRFSHILRETKLPVKTLVNRLNEMRELGLLELQTRTAKDGKAYNVYAFAPFGMKLTARLGSQTLADLIRIQE